jgi:hypothetical protein
MHPGNESKYGGSIAAAPVQSATNAAAPKGSQGIEGPERPTFVERAIAAVPLPYPVTCLILAALAESLGFLLANLVDTGSPDLALQLTFPGLATTTAPVVFAGAAFGIAFYTVLLYMVRYARRQLASASSSIAPLLPDGEAGFRRIYGRVHAPLPILLLAVLLGFFFWLSGSHAPLLGPARIVFIGLQLAVICFSTSAVLWTYFVTLWGVWRMGKEPLRLKPYTEDAMLGLRPLGSMDVSATMVYFAMIGVVLVTALVYPQTALYLAFLLALLAFGVLLFVLPLLGIHRLMLKEKRRIEAELAGLAAREWKEMEAAPPEGETGLAELRGMVVSLRRFVAHERAERKVVSLPTWPFDPQVTGRIAAIVLTGMVAVLGRAAVDWFVARPGP